MTDKKEVLNGWVRIFIQVATLVFLAGAAYIRLESLETALRETKTEMQSSRETFSIHRERLAALEVRSRSIESQLERIELKLDKLLDQ